MENILERKEPIDGGFSVAPDRQYIPREGFFPDAKYQQSVAPHPTLPKITPTREMAGHEVDFPHLWKNVLQSRLSKDKLEPIDYESLEFLAFGSTTEQLFQKFIVPMLKRQCELTGKTQLAMDEVSYLIPLWNRKELEPLQIVEGKLAKLIKGGGRLPGNVGVVFLDFPPNQQKKDYQGSAPHFMYQSTVFFL